MQQKTTNHLTYVQISFLKMCCLVITSEFFKSTESFRMIVVVLLEIMGTLPLEIIPTKIAARSVND